MPDKQKTYAVLQREYVLLSYGEFRDKWRSMSLDSQTLDSLAARCGWRAFLFPADGKFYVEYGLQTTEDWDSQWDWFVENALEYGYDGAPQKQYRAPDTLLWRIVAAGMAKALQGIAPEVRREHDAGDGHFSTEQVEAVEYALVRYENSRLQERR